MASSQCCKICVNFQYLGISIVINNSISEERAGGIRQILESELISECLQIISVSRLWRVSVVQQPVSPWSENELENNSSRAFLLFLLSRQCKAMITTLGLRKDRLISVPQWIIVILRTMSDCPTKFHVVLH